MSLAERTDKTWFGLDVCVQVLNRVRSNWQWYLPEKQPPQSKSATELELIR